MKVAQTCIRCGAPLSGNVCQYCGTAYSDRPLEGNFEDSYTGIIRINDMTIKCYIKDIEITYYPMIAGRDEKGRLHRPKYKKFRKITLVEI